MEDAHISDISIGPNGTLHLFGVFDGHGGKEFSQFVKVHFTEELLANKSLASGDIKTALIENFLRMDELAQETAGKVELKKYAKLSKEEDDKQTKNEKNKQMEIFKQLFDRKAQEDCDISKMTGCTACVCAIDQENKLIYVANSGDSRAVLCKKGVAYPMSIDHKPELDTEKNRIYKAGGSVVDGRVQGKNKIK